MVASLEQTCALASFQSQLVVASWPGVNMRLVLGEAGVGGSESSIITGLKIPVGV